MIEFIIFAVCMAGASWQAWKAGIKEGASRTVDKLHDAKIIAYNHEGNIVPNKFFDA